MRCEGCGKDKPDVREAISPYDQDVKNREVRVKLCNTCYEAELEDI